MANSESQFRSELKDDLEANGHAVTVVAQRYMCGVHDLHITGPWFMGFMELKFERAPVNLSTRVKVNLSDKQREFGKKQQAAGGRAGWMLCIRYKRQWRYYYSEDMNVTHVDQEQFNCSRNAGEPHDFTWLDQHK